MRIWSSLDSPPLQAVADSAILSSFLDGTLIVIDAERSRQRTVRLGRESLARAGANVLGAVLNRIPARVHSEYATYYGGNHEVEGVTKRALPGTRRVARAGWSFHPAAPDSLSEATDP